MHKVCIVDCLRQISQSTSTCDSQFLSNFCSDWDEYDFNAMGSHYWLSHVSANLLKSASTSQRAKHLATGLVSYKVFPISRMFDHLRRELDDDLLSVALKAFATSRAEICKRKKWIKQYASIRKIAGRRNRERFSLADMYINTNSTASTVLNRNRQSMSPIMLEAICFLKIKSVYWGPSPVAEALARHRSEKWETNSRGKRTRSRVLSP